MIENNNTSLFDVFLQPAEPIPCQNRFMSDLLEILKESVQAKACSVRLLEEDKLSAGVCIGYSYPARRNHTIAIDKRLHGLIDKPEPWIIPDIQNSDVVPKRRKNRLANEGFKSCIINPLQVNNGTVIGLLTVYFPYVKGGADKARLATIQMYSRMFAYLLYRVFLYEDIRDLKNLVQNVVEYTSDAILLTDELGKIIYVSKRTARLFHRRVHSLLGEYIFTFGRNQDSVFDSVLKAARRKSSLIHFDVIIPLKNDQDLFLRASIKKLQFKRFQRQMYIWFFRDETSLRHAEKNLNQKKEELEDFVYSVSHDLKSPIISLQGYTALMKEDLYSQFDDTYKHYFNRMVNNVDLMKQMIQDLLQLSRVGDLDSKVKTESTAEIVHEALDEFHYQFEKRNIQLIAPKRYPKIKCHRMGIRLVFTNLISNAIKFLGNDNSPRIELGWKRQKEYYEFYVKDNGIGISEEERFKIFNVFYRSQKLENVEGTGIGLAAVKKIVQRHGGEVRVESEPSKGSTFYFTLPKAIPEFN